MMDELLRLLMEDRDGGEDIGVPRAAADKRRLIRALMNVRPPRPAAQALLEAQDRYLQAELAARGAVPLSAIPACGAEPDLTVWRGDITRLAADAVVNAANSAMLGCFIPNHGCIDNAIHSRAGIQLRLLCAELMRRQGHEEPAGRAKLTPAFNLPSRYILHTVGPVVAGEPTKRDCELLASCYRSCLELAERHGLASVAFCCVSTGEFHFPNEPAARIAVDEVKRFKRQARSQIKVIFNVFKQLDEAIYRGLLGTA